MESTITHAWTGNNNSDPQSSSIAIEGDLFAVDVDLNEVDERVAEVQWSSGKLRAIWIDCPVEVILTFNWDTSPQTFEPLEGGVFQWDMASGIDCPVTGAVNNLRVTRTNPSAQDPTTNNIIKVRWNKDATP